MNGSARVGILTGLILVALPLRSQILGNGGFESGLSDWSTNVSTGDVANFTVVSNLVHSGGHALRVSVTNAGSAPDSVQLLHSPFIARADDTYVLRFWASSDIDFGDINVVLSGATPAFPEIPFKISTNANSYQEYIYPFRASGNISVGFNFKSSKDNYYLDDVEMLDLHDNDGWDVPMTYLWRWGQLDNSKTNPIGWGSGDNDKSVELPDGSILWIFNDSWMSRLSFYSNIHGGGHFCRNCAVHQVGTNLYTLSTNTFIEGTNAQNLFWIGDAVVDGNKVRVLLIEVNAARITREGTAIGTISLPDLKVESVTYIPSPAKDDYCPVLNGNDGYDYIYWTGANHAYGSSRTPHVRVARVPLGQLTNNAAWNYWNGTGWQTNHLLAAPLPTMVCPWSFTCLGTSNYAAVSMPSLTGKILAQFAPSPMGPWSPAVLVYQAPPEGGEILYMPNICAGTGADGVYTIAYSDNGPSDYLSKMASDKSFYSPHFIRANLRRLSPYTR